MTRHPNILLVVMDTARGSTVGSELRDGEISSLRRIADEGVSFSNAMSSAPWTVPSHASLFTGRYTSDHGTHAGNPTFDPKQPPLAARLRAAGYRTLGISGNNWISPEFGFDAGFDAFSMTWERAWHSADLTPIYSIDGVLSRLAALANRLTIRNAPGTLMNAVYAKFLAGRHDDGARNTTDRTIDWLRDNAESRSPFFFFINYIEPHLEYDPPERYRRELLDADELDRAATVNQDPWEYVAGQTEMTAADFDILEKLYRAELRYVDEQIGRLYEALETAGVLDETAIVIVGDHGENIGDHGLMDHQYCLYETLLNVPLIVRYPPAFPRGERVDGLFELRDLYPTLLALAGVDVSDSNPASSWSLVPDDGDIIGRERTVAEYMVPQPSIDTLQANVESFRPEATQFDRGLRSIRTEQWKLVEGTDGSTELYDVTADPSESDDISADNEAVVRDLQSELQRELGPLRRGSVSEYSLSESSKERLEQLGYLQ